MNFRYTYYSVALCFCLFLISWLGISNAANTVLEWKQLNQKNGLSSNRISALAVFENKMMIGTDKGLNIYNPQSESIVLYNTTKGLPHNSIRSLYNAENRLWIGTEHGLAFIEKNTVTAIKTSPLQRITIQAMAIKDDTLYLGTPKGMYLYNLKTMNVTKPKHLRKNEIRVLKKVEQGLIICTEKSHSSLFKPQTSRFENLQLEFNPTENQITAIGALGDYIWFASDGSGLIGYNIMTYQWFSFQNVTEVDSFANALLEDGRYLWYGAFSGLYRYDVIDDLWTFYPNEDLQTFGVSALAINGTTLWVGTPSGGLLYADKRLPNLSIGLSSRYYSNELIKLRGIMEGFGQLEVEMSYRPLADPQKWLTEHTTLKARYNDFDATINFDALDENIYEFKFTVVDTSGNKNENRFTLVKEMHGVKLVPKPTTLKTGRTRLTGEYDNPDIMKIILNPGNTEATLNPANQTFSGEVVLTLEDKQIQLSMYEAKGEVNNVYYPIKVRPAPKFKIIPLATTFIPGLSEVPFHITFENRIASVDYWELRISTPAGERVRTISGYQKLPQTLNWDGKNTNGQTVAEGHQFYYSFFFLDHEGLEISTPQGLLQSSVTYHPTGKRIREKISGVFLFKRGEPLLIDNQKEFFQSIVETLRSNPDSLLAIEGHTDNKPILTDQFASNQRLSEARAEFIKNQLVSKYGLAKTKLITVGYGASLPTASNKRESGRIKNRRVEVYLLK